MVARKKVDEQAEITAEMLERSNVAEKAMKALDRAMINKALLLLEASGEGAGDLKIKQIETAIEIYKAVQIL